MITAMDSRVMDANAEALGVPVSVLMDNAGKAVARFLEDRFPTERILFVCGPGNNGGDGFAAALRMDPKRVCVALLKKPSSIHTDIARERYSLLECPIEAYSSSCLDGCDVIVDCALGTGISGNVRDPYLTFINDANASGKTIVSVDVPSGLGTSTVIVPEYTVTFCDVKQGMDNDSCGTIIVSDIGMPEDAYRIVGPGDMQRYPVPAADSHKGDNGRLMIIAGGPYYGAPAMCSMAALRTGTDIVRLFTPASVSRTIASYSPVLMITELPGNCLDSEEVDDLLRASMDYDAVLIGPGLGTAPETVLAVKEFVRKCRTPVVIDADGLTAIAGMRLSAPAVLTPHKGEFARLGGSDEDVAALASSVNATVVLKKREDVISDGRTTRVNRSGSPGMTGAGTGDVLAGIVAALLSKGMSPFDAACLGAYISGRAGELAFDDLSYGMVATDIIDRIPMVLREHLR